MERDPGDVSLQITSGAAAQYEDREGLLQPSTDAFNAGGEAQSNATISISPSITEYDFRFPRRPTDSQPQDGSSSTSGSLQTGGSIKKKDLSAGSHDELYLSAANIAYKEVPPESFIPIWEDDIVGEDLDSTDETQKKDPLATHTWRLYSKTKELHKQERIENMQWRMVAMNLRKRRQEEEDARLALQNSAQTVRALIAPSGIAQVRKTSYQTIAGENSDATSIADLIFAENIPTTGLGMFPSPELPKKEISEKSSDAVASAMRKSHFLTLPQQLYRCVSWLLRPRVKVGYQRLKWKCDCGTPLYGDFRGEPKEIDKLGMDLQARGYVIPQHSTPRTQAVPLNTGQQHHTSSSTAQVPPTSNLPQSAPTSFENTIASSVAGGLTNPTSGVFVASPTLSTPLVGIPRYLALCVNNNKFKKTLIEIHISSVNEDALSLRKFKEKYEESRSLRTKALRNWLIQPVDIKFIQFAVEHSQRVYAIFEPPDCTLCAHKDNQDTLINSRQYEPHHHTVALVHPPIPRDAFFHLWDCPQDTTKTQARWIDRLPKKLHESLQEVRRKQQLGDDTLVLGWGILIVEGLNKSALSWLTFLVVVMSGIISMLYAVWTRDTSGAFAIGAYIVAVLVALITALYYQWEKE